MSWETMMSDQPAAFRGVAFDVLNSSDDLTFAYAAHTYPYKAGANIEDTGREARMIRLTAVFWQEDYEEPLAELLKVLNQPGSGELVHPVFGIINAKVVSIGIPFDAGQPNYCELPIQWVEDALDTPLFVVSTVPGQAEAIDASIDAAVEASIDPFDKSIAATEPFNFVADKQNALQAMQESISTMQDEVRKLGAGAFEMLGTLTNTVDYIISPVSFIQDMQSGFNARLDAFMGRVELLRYIPDQLQKALFGSGKSVATKPKVPTWQETRDHVRQPVLSKQYQSADNVLRDRYPAVMVQVQYQQALALARSANDFLVSDAAAELTPNEIAAVATDTRTDLLAAMTAWRGLYGDLNDSRPVTETLKKIAVDLQALAESIINRHPPLIERVTHAPGNLRLIAHWWYKDATRADELLRLNPSIQEPNFITPGTRLNAYAK